MTGTKQPKVTPAEALQYDHDALLRENEKRKQNIEIFEKAIREEKEGIERNLQMVALIELHTKKKK